MRGWVVPIGWGICVFLWPAAVIGSSDLTDVQKKEIVYRMYAEFKNDFPEVNDIEPREAMKLAAENHAVFVDVRDPAEMKVSMLPHAITKKSFLENPQRFADRTIIVYCTISYRSGKFAEEMARKGVTLYNLKGGLLAWVLEGGTVFDSHGESKRIHVYGEKWNFVPKGYEAVWYGFFDRFLQDRPGTE